MTVIDLWAVMPLFIIAAGAVTVLLFGAVAPGRHGYAVAIIALSGAALWALQTPPPGVPPLMGMSVSPFARFFTVLFSLAGMATLMQGYDYTARRHIRGEEFPATVLFAVFGMTALAGATNLIILFLALEALTFAFYILVAIDLARADSAEAGLKYLLMGAVAAAFIAFGIALIYSGSGTMQIVAAMKAFSRESARPFLIAGWGFLLIGFAFKLSLVPAHLWTPDVYQGAPAPVAGFLATGSKGGAVAALLLLLSAVGDGSFLRIPLWWFALLSMVVGNLAALVQHNLKRMLAYSAIAQMGYVTLALLTLSRDGYGGAIFYVAVYTVMNLAAFGAIASLAKDGGMERIEDLRGAGFAHPFQGGVLVCAMFALAGIPPTAGFVGKFFIFYAAIKGGETPLAVIGILTAAISAYYYLRVVVNLYMRHEEPAPRGAEVTIAETVVLGICTILILALGVWPGPLLDLVAGLL